MRPFDNYPTTNIALFLSAFVLALALGTAILWIASPVYALGYLALISLVGFSALNLVCRNCAYRGKRCIKGFSLVAGFMPPGSKEGFKKGILISPFLIGLLFLVPLAFGLWLVIEFPTGWNYIILKTYVLLAFLSLTLNKTLGCPRCKMRDICPIGKL